MEALLERLERALWGWPLLTLLLGAGLWLLLRLRLLPLRELPLAFRLLFRSAEKKGGVSAFGALCTSLSAAIGAGNIVGVATALSLGGPGALLWMELSALTGLSLKYAEGLLAVRFRERDRNGRPRGGPFAYIRLGLGARFQWLAGTFAALGALSGLCGVGTFVQVGSVSACLNAWLSRTRGTLSFVILPGGRAVPLAGMLAGPVMAVLAALVIFGGMERVSRVSTVLVPLMGGLYVLGCLWILLRFHELIPEALLRVWSTALQARGLGGGLLGAVTAGVSRGVFSNEAGLGTAPIAAASAEGVTPREQGLISMTATVFDTLLICTLTGLVILVTGSEGAGLTASMTAFSRGLPLPRELSEALVCGILSLFCFTTVTGWSCYGTACLDHLSGGSAPLRKAYLALYVCSVALAPLCSARGIWTAANICNGLMAIPNVTALLLLTNRIREASGLPTVKRKARLDFPASPRYNTES